MEAWDPAGVRLPWLSALRGPLELTLPRPLCALPTHVNTRGADGSRVRRVSEYQHYEFLAMDRPLDSAQQAQVRALSTRARITATSFTNDYQWGNFRGDPRRLVELYYDAHLYVTNWGTHQVMLRLPKKLLDLRAVQPYLLDEHTEAWTTGTHLIVDLRSDDEGGDWDETAEDSLAAIVGVRAELTGGDLRALYLAWLSTLTAWEREDDNEEEFRRVLEPPVPAGLAELTAPQRALADFLRVDPDLLAVAAEADAAAAAQPPLSTKRDLAPLVAALPEKDKNAFLLRLALGQDPHLPTDLLHCLLGAPSSGTLPGRRSAALLLDAAHERRENRKRHALRQAAHEAGRRERAEAAVREQRLASVAEEGEAAWQRVDSLIDTKRAAEYDMAITLLQDLQEISTRAGQSQEFGRRLHLLRQQHHRKPAFIRRLDHGKLPR